MTKHFAVTLMAFAVPLSSTLGVMASTGSDAASTLVSYTPRDPIFVSGNANFSTANGVIRGTGSSGKVFLSASRPITPSWRGSASGFS